MSVTYSKPASIRARAPFSSADELVVLMVAVEGSFNVDVDHSVLQGFVAEQLLDV